MGHWRRLWRGWRRRAYDGDTEKANRRYHLDSDADAAAAPERYMYEGFLKREWTSFDDCGLELELDAEERRSRLRLSRLSELLPRSLNLLSSGTITVPRSGLSLFLSSAQFNASFAKLIASSNGQSGIAELYISMVCFNSNFNLFISASSSRCSKEVGRDVKSVQLQLRNYHKHKISNANEQCALTVDCEEAESVDKFEVVLKSKF
ncbi:hypothetical protein SDJN02_07882, partial [Cucurbita argyrosperma subsp. argyrosperma]